MMDNWLQDPMVALQGRFDPAALDALRNITEMRQEPEAKPELPGGDELEALHTAIRDHLIEQKRLSLQMQEQTAAQNEQAARRVSAR